MKVSVCLATYNGEAFIEEQLRSILADLAPDDEVVICDDASSDRTLSIVEAIGDARIIVHAFKDNVRHVRNFERALVRATGDLIFLSDQDDIWQPGKRRAVTQVFAEQPDVIMVVHALRLIDANGDMLQARVNTWPSSAAGVQSTVPYLLRQIVRNQITGCAVAFHRDLLEILLPFPKDVYAHDHWLSVAAPLAGRVFFLDKPLLQYRHHSANVTPRSGLGTVHRLLVRARLSQLLATAFLRLSKKRSDFAATT